MSAESFNDTPSVPIPDYITPFIQYRIFTIGMDGNDAVLYSPHQSVIWETPILEAKCGIRCKYHKFCISDDGQRWLCGAAWRGRFYRVGEELTDEDKAVFSETNLPHSLGSCGIYTSHSFDELADSNTMPLFSNNIMAACKISGKIQVHHDGCRSERVEVIALCDIQDLMSVGSCTYFPIKGFEDIPIFRCHQDDEFLAYALTQGDQLSESCIPPAEDPESDSIHRKLLHYTALRLAKQTSAPGGNGHTAGGLPPMALTGSLLTHHRRHAMKNALTNSLINSLINIYDQDAEAERADELKLNPKDGTEAGDAG